MKSSKKSKFTVVLCACISLSSISIISAFAASRSYQNVTAEYEVSSSYSYIDITENLGKVAHTATADLGSTYNSDISMWGKRHIFQSGETGYVLKQYGSGTAVCAGIGSDYNSNNFVFKYEQ